MKTIVKTIGFIFGAAIVTSIYLAMGTNSYKDMIENQFSAAISCAMRGMELNDFRIETVAVFDFKLWDNYFYNCRDLPNLPWWSR